MFGFEFDTFICEALNVRQKSAWISSCMNFNRNFEKKKRIEIAYIVVIKNNNKVQNWFLVQYFYWLQFCIFVGFSFIKLFVIQIIRLILTANKFSLQIFICSKNH